MPNVTQKKPLSEAAARSCEEARGATCHCRCGGAFHGGKRGGSQYGKQTDGTFFDTPREFFEQLPPDDPHYLLSAEIKRQRAEERKAQKRKEREEATKRKWNAIIEMEKNAASRGLFW